MTYRITASDSSLGVLELKVAHGEVEVARQDGGLHGLDLDFGLSIGLVSVAKNLG